MAGLVIYLFVSSILKLARGDGFDFLGSVLALTLLNLCFDFVPPVISLTEDGLRVKNLITSCFYRWDEVEWYRLFASSVHIKVCKGKQKKMEWLLLNFDRTKTDESTLTRILQSKLAGRKA